MSAGWRTSSMTGPFRIAPHKISSPFRLKGRISDHNRAGCWCVGFVKVAEYPSFPYTLGGSDCPNAIYDSGGDSPRREHGWLSPRPEADG